MSRRTPTQDDSASRGLIALEKDRERAGSLVSQLRNGTRIWTDLTARERRVLAGAPLLEYLHEVSYSHRFDDPKLMLDLAKTACALAQALSTRRYGRKVVADLQTRAWAELANAYRVNDDLENAGSALARANVLAEKGTRSSALMARISELIAHYLTELRRFGEAVALLEQVQAFYVESADVVSLARTHLILGHTLTQANESERASVAFLRALSCIEPYSPLRLVAIHGLASSLVESGSFEGAQRLLTRFRRLYRRSGKLNEYRSFWLEGKISLGLEEFGQAEAKLNTAKLAFLRLKKPYDAALVSLDLALVYIHQRRHQEVIWLVDEMLRTFRALGIARESIASLLLLRKSCEQKRSVDILCGQIESLAKLMPELRRQGKKNSEES